MSAALSTIALGTDIRAARIPIALIDVPAGRRRLDPAWVETLADLFAGEGQRTPIEVVATGERYRLVFGGHRLAAGRQLGWSEIGAIVKAPEDYASEAEIVQAEITENLVRRELSALDKAVDLARWREAYNAAHLVAKGRPRKAKDTPEQAEEISAKFCTLFSNVAQKALGISRRSIYLALKIASIEADVRERIALHAVADNQSELLALAAEAPARQDMIAALLTSAKAGSVGEAIAIIDRVAKPAAEPRWQKVSTAFAGLKEAEQDRFFDLHEGAIQRWLKGRSS